MRLNGKSMNRKKDAIVFIVINDTILLSWIIANFFLSLLSEKMKEKERENKEKKRKEKRDIKKREIEI